MRSRKRNGKFNVRFSNYSVFLNRLHCLERSMITQLLWLCVCVQYKYYFFLSLAPVCQTVFGISNLGEWKGIRIHTCRREHRHTAHRQWNQHGRFSTFLCCWQMYQTVVSLSIQSDVLKKKKKKEIFDVLKKTSICTSMNWNISQNCRIKTMKMARN